MVAHDIDALVYLVAGTDQTPGRLVGVGRDGRAIVNDLPDLVVRPDGPLTRFIAADQDEPAEWRAVLEELSDWAGNAVLGTPLEAVGCGRQVVLVPSGKLGAVSWSAARLGSRGSVAPNWSCPPRRRRGSSWTACASLPRRSTAHRSW